MVQGWEISQEQHKLIPLDKGRLQQWIRGDLWNQENLLWIDIDNPSDEDFQLLTEQLELHSTVAEYIQREEIRPKVQRFQKYFYIAAYSIAKEMPHEIDENKQEFFEIKLSEIDFLVGENYIVTVRQRAVPAWDNLVNDWMKFLPQSRQGISYVIYELLDGILEEYFPVLDDISQRIDQLEDLLFSEDGQAVTSEIFDLKRMLVRIRRVSSPMREVTMQLSRYFMTSHDENNGIHAYFQDLYDHAMRITETLDSFRDILSSSVDVYLAAQGNRMNEVMKTLTSFSIIFLLPTLIAGIYGMNFENMPELHHPLAYFICLGVIILSMAGMFWYFKQRDWI